MKRRDEALLMACLRRHRPTPSYPIRISALDVGRLAGIHPKRVHYLLVKWTRQGIWDYGVAPESGWFVDQDAPQP